MKLEVLGDPLLPESLVLFSLSVYLLSCIGNILLLAWHPWEEEGKQSYVHVLSPACALGFGQQRVKLANSRNDRLGSNSSSIS